MKTKKEIRNEYKQMKFQMGVFRIRNKKNGKIWIGSGINIPAVLNSEKFQLNIGMHPNKVLQKDWTELGEDNFSCEVIEEIKQGDDDSVDYKREVKSLEDLLIEDLKPYYNSVYNQKKA
jgi:hypothetical protein